MSEETPLVNAMHQHVNTITSRLINAEVALDVVLGIIFEQQEGFKDEFAKKFEARIKELNEARETATVLAEADYKASLEKTTDKEETSPIITP